MTAEYVIALLGLIGSAGGVVALIWAIRHRQIETGDQAMYEAIADDEPDYTVAAGQASVYVSRPMRWFVAVVLALVFLLVSWLIVQTVRVGTRAVHPPPAGRRLPP